MQPVYFGFAGFLPRLWFKVLVQGFVSKVLVRWFFCFDRFCFDSFQFKGSASDFFVMKFLVQTLYRLEFMPFIEFDSETATNAFMSNEWLQQIHREANGLPVTGNRSHLTNIGLVEQQILFSGQLQIHNQLTHETANTGQYFLLAVSLDCARSSNSRMATVKMD